MSFDTLARHYRWMEFVLAGEKLQRCRTAFLQEIPSAKNILLLGEGHGRFLVPCRKQFPDGRITCVDGSAGMIAQARRRLAQSGFGTDGVTYLQADLLAWIPLPEAKYDLIATDFLLDCFGPAQLERIIRLVSGAAAEKANWLLADFQVAAKGLRRCRSQIILWLMYRFFRLTTRLPASRLTSPSGFLQKAGFELHRSLQSEWGLLHSDWWQRPGRASRGDFGNRSRASDLLPPLPGVS